MKFFKRKRTKRAPSIVEEKMANVDIKRVFGDVISGNMWTSGFLVKQMPFILLVVFLSLIYINNRFLYESELKSNLRLNQELHNVKYRSLTLSKDLLEHGSRSGIQEKLKGMGSDLKESYKPVVVVD